MLQQPHEWQLEHFFAIKKENPLISIHAPEKGATAKRNDNSYISNICNVENCKQMLSITRLIVLQEGASHVRGYAKMEFAPSMV